MNPLDGAWRIRAYIKDGVGTPIEGVLLFAGGWWALYCVLLRPGGDWTSAETGPYDMDGAALRLHHRFKFQGTAGGPGTTARDMTHVEACTFTVEGETLSITFASGNLLALERLRD